MRIFKDGVEELVQELGVVPGIENILRSMKRFYLLDPRTLSQEKVFANSHRLVAASDYFKGPPRYSLAPRKRDLTTIMEPLGEWLKSFYPDCRPILMQVATLPPKVKLMWHIDCYLYQSVSHKVHIPITTNDNALYMAQDVHNDDAVHHFHFEVGKAYEINNIMMHSAINLGTTPRAHMIIDMMHEEDIAHWEAENIDFFFTHHPDNKAAEGAATLRALQRNERS